MRPINNVVLTHCEFMNGSTWEAVYEILKRHDLNVSIVQNSTASLESDVAAVHRALNAHAGECVLVGHGYGGVVITEAGRHSRASRLVYVSAFVPDAGESASHLIARFPTEELIHAIPPVLENYWTLDKTTFSRIFKDDIGDNLREFMADSQTPWGMDAFHGKISEPAWRAKPSWYLLATEDRVLAPSAQRYMATRAGSTVADAVGGRAIHMSNPRSVASLIKMAAGIT